MDRVRVSALKRGKCMDLLTEVSPTPLQQVAVFPLKATVSEPFPINS